MVWLAGRYEASQVQSRLERDTADAVSDIRVALTRNLQSLQALHAGDPGQLAWEVDAAELLRNRRELVRIEWRDADLRVRTHAQSPYRPVAWDARLREGNQSDAAIACANARRLSSPAYSSSYFQPHGDGLGSGGAEGGEPEAVPAARRVGAAAMVVRVVAVVVDCGCPRAVTRSG